MPSMKLSVGLYSFAVVKVRNFHDLSEFDKVNHNGQHLQVRNRVLAEVWISGDGHSTITLLHPDTGPGTGHVDVYVEYGTDPVPTFHHYQNHNKFVPQNKDCGGQQDMVWPTGGWSLIQTVLAIESYLESEIGFTPKLRQAFFSSLK